ncbi:hypothetical protein [Corynebacterium diphtheriae]|uniref:hypothetical protein n=1 Tax=Corynebacterium diphtheriae TaxID=1717 RepID=UPI001603F537|nr:hypothetical protein [Corynebacterium diphtheriae]
MSPLFPLAAGAHARGVILVKYRPKNAELRKLLRGDIAQKLVTEHAERLAAEAGDGYTVSYKQGKTRFRAIVYADTIRAKIHEARENNLLRVLG